MTNTVETGNDQATLIQEMARRFGVDPVQVAQHVEDMERQIAGYLLREIREAQGVSHRELAKRLGVSQNRVSKIEKGRFDKTQVDTIARYVEALGGTLVVQARLKDQVVELR